MSTALKRTKNDAKSYYAKLPDKEIIEGKEVKLYKPIYGMNMITGHVTTQRITIKPLLDAECTIPKSSRK